MSHHAKVVPVYARRRDPALVVEVRSTVGYRFVCSCGFRGAVRGTGTLARVEGASHRPVAVGGGNGPNSAT